MMNEGKNNFGLRDSFFIIGNSEKKMNIEHGMMNDEERKNNFRLGDSLFIIGDSDRLVYTLNLAD